MLLAAILQYIRGPMHDRRHSKIRSIEKMIRTQLNVDLTVSGFCSKRDTHSRYGGTFSRVKLTLRGAWYFLDV